MNVKENALSPYLNTLVYHLILKAKGITLETCKILVIPKLQLNSSFVAWAYNNVMYSKIPG